MLKLHHTGFVVANLKDYESKMILENKINEVYDEIQDANLALYSNYGSSFIELIQPISTNSMTYNFLNKTKGGFHHFCYEINAVDLDIVVAEYKLIKLMDIVPAKLFNNQNVAFYYAKNRQVVEFLLKE